MPKKRVLIACSAKNGIPAYWFSSYDALMRMSHPEYEWYFSVEDGNNAINLSRNILAEYAIEHDFWKLVMLDSDHLWKPEHLLRLLSHNEPIVGGLYCKKRGGEVDWLAVHSHDAKIRDDGLLECDFIATGVLCVGVAVLKTMKERFPEREFVYDDENRKPKTMHELFPIGLVGPNTPEGRLARIKEIVYSRGEWAPEKMIQAVHGVFEINHPQRGRLLGEDYHFPVAPDTPVLGADWRWRPLEKFNVGDSVVAMDEFSPPHSSRRMQISHITHFTKRILPEYRIVTDSRELRTTAEHPWLSIDAKFNPLKTKWSWTPTAQLTVGGVVARVVPVSENPDVESLDYAEGYVQGIFHSDGYRNNQQGSYVLKMCDTEPIERTATALAMLGVESTRSPIQRLRSDYWKPLHGIGVYRRASFTKLHPMVTQTGMRSKAFAAGYLAGKYDGDGSYAGTQLQIASIVDWKKDRMEEAAKLLGINFKRNDKVVYVCSNAECYDFWMKTSPALRRRMLPIGQIGNDGVKRTHEIKHNQEKIVAVEKTGRLAEMWCATTDSGTFIASGIASHNCHLARKAGFKIYVDTKVVVGHVGNAVYPLEQSKLSVAGGIPGHNLSLDQW